MWIAYQWGGTEIKLCFFTWPVLSRINLGADALSHLPGVCRFKGGEVR